MRKPEVTLNNYKSVYDYYKQYKQPRTGAYIGHKVMSWMFRPQVEYNKGAEDSVYDMISGSDTRVIIALNHLSDNDQYVVASMAIKEPAFKPMVGNTFIQSKEPLFHHPNKLLRPFLRRGVDVMGAIPAFRKKDISEDQADLRRLATNELIQISIDKLRSGQNMAIFPEGSRNIANPDIVQELRPGIIAVASQVALTHQVSVVPVGFTYEGNKRQPSMWVGEPILDSGFSADTFLPLLHGSLQNAVDNARSNVQ